VTGIEPALSAWELPSMLPERPDASPARGLEWPRRPCDGIGLWPVRGPSVVLAPRERDLMFQIGGVLADAQVTSEQQAWFFDGYGAMDVDARRLAYYRCSWSVQDLAAFAARVRNQSPPTPDREEAFRFLAAVLSPTGIVAAALASLESLGHAPPTFQA
jgi:spectinomycin phosphotransferase